MRGYLLTYSLLFLFSITSFQFSFAQQKFNYDREWKKVDSLLGKSKLTQSALVRIDKIYNVAKKERSDAQVIKSLIYKTTLQQTIEENGQIKEIQRLEKEINSANEPARSILKSILAD